MPDVKRQLVLVEVEGAGGPVEVLVNNSKRDGLEGGTPVNGNFVTELPRVGSTGSCWPLKIRARGSSFPAANFNPDNS